MKGSYTLVDIQMTKKMQISDLSLKHLLACYDNVFDMGFCISA